MIRFARKDQSIPLHIIAADDLSDWIDTQDNATAGWIKSNGFTGQIGQAVAVPDVMGQIKLAVVGYGTANTRKRARFHLAAGMGHLPEGVYDIVSAPDGADLTTEALGALLAGYRFDRYKDQPAQKAKLAAPDRIDAKAVERIARAECLTRDLINTPASDMGPAALETACCNLADKHDASVLVITGDDLIKQNFPMIHAVGRAADQAPRLIDMRWGTRGPTLTLVGKGVCFDTGGLNIKPGSSMGLMKKDMGGAANVLGLADMIMGSGMDVQLRVLIPAVENSINSNAFRPQDILTSRKGLSVEINNTDAEGRLVLADALALGAEETPDLMISMATLTGAARVAVGPDLAPFYTDEDRLSDALCDAACKVADPVWQLPFWDPYEPMIEPSIADLDNAPSGGFAGSITAALFLRRFADGAQNYMHFDIYGWQPSPAPARPKGGVGQGIRALFAALPNMLSK